MKYKHLRTLALSALLACTLCLGAAAGQTITADTYAEFARQTAALNAQHPGEEGAAARLIFQGSGLELSALADAVVIAGPEGHYICQCASPAAARAAMTALRGQPGLRFVQQDGIVTLQLPPQPGETPAAAPAKEGDTQKDKPGFAAKPEAPKPTLWQRLKREVLTRLHLRPKQEHPGKFHPRAVDFGQKAE